MSKKEEACACPVFKVTAQYVANHEGSAVFYTESGCTIVHDEVVEAPIKLGDYVRATVLSVTTETGTRHVIVAMTRTHRQRSDRVADGQLHVATSVLGRRPTLLANRIDTLRFGKVEVPSPVLVETADRWIHGAIMPSELIDNIEYDVYVAATFNWETRHVVWKTACFILGGVKSLVLRPVREPQAARLPARTALVGGSGPKLDLSAFNPFRTEPLCTTVAIVNESKQEKPKVDSEEKMLLQYIWKTPGVKELVKEQNEFLYVKTEEWRKRTEEKRLGQCALGMGGVKP